MRRIFGGRARRPFETEPRAEVSEELAFHLEQRTRDYIARGMDPAAARDAALARLGDLAGVQHECTEMLEADRRAASRRDWLSDLRQVVRFGARAALRAPLFSLLAIITLALGIGANAAVFGVVKSVLLDALPYADADRLMRMYANKKDGTFDRMTLSAAAIMDIAQRQRSFERLGIFMPLGLQTAYADDQGPRPLTGALAGSGFFQTLGVRPHLGRLLRDDDLPLAAPRVVVLSHSAWQRLFAGDSTVIGRAMNLNGNPFEVIGILPPSFVSPIGDIDTWSRLDLAPTLADPIRARRRSWLALVGRLKPGVTAEAATREIHAIGAELGREHPDADGLFTLTALPLRDDLVGDMRTPLIVLTASAGLVLLITCANLAGALVSRTISRRREFAVRMALGAGRGRLIRQLLTESMLLSIVGGVVGIALATGGLAVLRGLALPALPPYAELALDRGALLVTFALALATGLAFGLAPALSVGRSNLEGTLRDESRAASESRRSRRLRGALVAGQIALCVSLLAGAGLLARSLWALTSAPLGFQPDGVLTATLPLPSRQYPTAESRALFHRQLEERILAVPGVTGMAMSSAVPGNVQSHDGFTIVGAPWAPAEGQQFVLSVTVSDGYFDALGIPVRQGRTFEPADRHDAAPVIVISESMARRYWPKGDAIGSRIRLGPDPASQPLEVIGIVADVRNGAAQQRPEPMAYGSARRDPWTDVLLVRTAGDPLSLVQPIQRAVTGLDAMLPLHQPLALRALLSAGLSGRTLPVMLMGAFALLALLLASVGIYAMFAAMAAAREREFSVRLALGSTRAGIATLVLRQGGAWMVAGLAGGAVGVYVMTRVLRGLLFGVSQSDPLALGLAIVMLVVCATVALLVPVRRATRVDPATVLR